MLLMFPWSHCCDVVHNSNALPDHSACDRLEFTAQNICKWQRRGASPWTAAHLTSATLTYCEALLASKLAAKGIDGAVVLQDVDEVQVVALARSKIVGVVGRRDLHGSCSKAHVHQLGVLDDGHLTPIQGMHHKLAVQVLVPVYT